MNYLIALSVPLLWGTSYALIGLYLLDIPAPWLAVWRALPAGILLFMLRPRFISLPKNQMLLISLGNIAVFFPLLITAIYLLPGSVAGTLGATFPLVMMFFNWLIYKVVPQLKFVVSALIGLFGVTLLLNPDADVNLWGVAAAFAAISSMSVTSIWMKRLVIDDVLNVSAWQLMIGGVLMIPFATYSAGAFSMPSSETWPALIWLVVLNTAYGYWAWVRSLKMFGTDTMGIFSLLNPLMAVLLGVFLMREQLDNLQFIGISLIFIALLMPTKVFIQVAALILPTKLRKIISS